MVRFSNKVSGGIPPPFALLIKVGAIRTLLIVRDVRPHVPDHRTTDRVTTAEVAETLDARRVMSRASLGLSRCSKSSTSS